jgi:hypothetical protein
VKTFFGKIFRDGFESSAFACTGPAGDCYSVDGVLFEFDEFGYDGLFVELCVYFIMLMEDSRNVGVQITSDYIELIFFMLLVIREST